MCGSRQLDVVQGTFTTLKCDQRHLIALHPLTTDPPLQPATACLLLLQVENAKTNLVVQMEILGRVLVVVIVLIAVSAFLLAYLKVGSHI